MSSAVQEDAGPGGLSTRGEPAVDFNDVFSLRKPKDAKAGFASGLKSIAKGVVAGAAGLVAAPIVGAQKEGWMGLGKGIAAGVVGAVVLPVTGAAVGTFQVVRGVVNQGEALVEASKGKVWDEDRREWIDKPDGALITAEAAKASTRNLFKAPTSGVDYYEVLQVPRDATPEAIKKAYYMLAKKWHPDKNPGDESAHDRFQLLGEAYQVLGNEELRARYDAHGSEGLDVNFMDSAEFFGMLFGHELFEHLVGELAIATSAKTGGELGAAAAKAVQAARVEKLAVNLKAMLTRYVAGDVEGFKLAMKAEAEQLAGASFGETMLHAIGRVYEQQADIALGGFFGGIAAKMKASTESMKSQINAASAVLKVYQAQQRIEQWEREQEKKQAAEAAAAAAAEAEAAAKTAGQAGATAAAPGTGEAGDGGGAAQSAGGAAAAGPGPSSTAAAGQQQQADKKDGKRPKSGSKAEAAAAQAASDALLERQALEEAALPLMLEAMWAANVLDIQHTLRKVCEKVLEEKGPTSLELRTRALALKELAGIFQRTHTHGASGSGDRASGGGAAAAAGTSGAGAAAGVAANGSAAANGTAAGASGSGAEAGAAAAGGASGGGAGGAGGSGAAKAPAAKGKGAGSGAGVVGLDAKEARQKMEDAMMRVMEKRAGMQP